MKPLMCWLAICVAATTLLAGCKRDDSSSTSVAPGLRPPGVATAAAREGMAGGAAAEAGGPGQPAEALPAGTEQPTDGNQATTPGDPGAAANASAPTGPEQGGTGSGTAATPSAGSKTSSGEGFVIRAAGTDFRVRWAKLKQGRLKELGVPVYQGAKGIEPVEPIDSGGAEAFFMLCEKDAGTVGGFYTGRLTGWGNFQDTAIAMATLMAAQQASKQPGSKAPTPEEIKKEVLERMPGVWRISQDGTMLVIIVPIEGQKRTAVAVIRQKEGILSLMAQGGDLAIPGLAPSKHGGASERSSGPRRGP